MMKTAKGATSGLFAETIWGTIVATWYDVARVERSVALPGLIRTVKLMGNYGLTFGAISGIYIGVDQMVEKDRMKKDFINSAVGGFVAGASVLGFKGHPPLALQVTQTRESPPIFGRTWLKVERCLTWMESQKQLQAAR
ncbi:outer envelope pore protein 16-3, chloroplastic/mitochondrial-like isoform X1 [Nymphaea colorata]|nr:outer envelope pore protein 16-3, chloroplastic/mitochondrial-like isoform X1 [Nymphaea colorata]